MNRGDVVKLMYYPNIANGDLSGATSESRHFSLGSACFYIVR